MFIYFSHEILFFIFFFIISYTWGIHPAKDLLLKSSSDSNDKLDKDSIKIVSWNIAKNKKNNWLPDLTEIFNFFRPDIYILQEVKLDKRLKDFFKEKFLAWRFSPNIIHLKKKLYSGVLTASPNLPGSESFRKTISREPVTFTSKATLFTTYDIEESDKKLLVINIHGINFVSLKKFRSQIHDIIQQGQKHNGPIIFSGDFNTWSKNRISFLKRILRRKLNLIPVDFHRKDRRKIKSFIFSPPLDHIFYSYKQLALVKNSSLVLRHFNSSDHKPIFAEFKLRHVEEQGTVTKEAVAVTEMV